MNLSHPNFPSKLTNPNKKTTPDHLFTNRSYMHCCTAILHMVISLWLAVRIASFNYKCHLVIYAGMVYVWGYPPSKKWNHCQKFIMKWAVEKWMIAEPQHEYFKRFLWFSKIMFSPVALFTGAKTLVWRGNKCGQCFLSAKVYSFCGCLSSWHGDLPRSQKDQAGFLSDRKWWIWMRITSDQ